MDRIEAMKQAIELVRSTSLAPTKTNGYTVDGWRSPTAAERHAETMAIAEFLVGGVDGPVRPEELAALIHELADELAWWVGAGVMAGVNLAVADRDKYAIKLASRAKDEAHRLDGV